MRRVVMWSTDPVGERMAGPGIRYHRLAIELAKRFDVTLVGPRRTGVDSAPYDYRCATDVDSAQALRADVVVSQRLPFGLARSLRREGVQLVYDLYVPALIEGAAHLAGQGDQPEVARLRYTELRAVQRFALELGDAFICASERQRDLWLGSLATLGRLEPAVYARDPSLRALIDVVPFGLDPASLAVSGPALRGVVAGVGQADRLLLWGGGLWNWLDPLTVVRAVSRLAGELPDVRLVFLGMRHPSPDVEAMSMAERTVALARELGLEGRHVFFNRDWVPYDRRLDFFREADLGVSAHPDTAEARFAFRTRLLDHFCVGTPVVTTSGDVLADFVEAKQLGRIVSAGDVDGWVDALRSLLGDRPALQAARDRVLESRAVFAWERVAEPLVRLVEEGTRSSEASGGAIAVARTSAALLRGSVARRGISGTARALVDRRKGPPEQRPD